MTTLTTARLILRPWTVSDFAPFAALNADPRVMEFFPNRLIRVESDGFATRIRERFEEQGWGLWVVEVADATPFIGFVGLSRPTFNAHFTPCVEIGWRLAAAHWGHGYASEAARAALAYGLDMLGFPEIVAFTVPMNLRSRAVMERIGMRRDPADDFDHPILPEGHPLRRHVLYRTAKLK